MSGKLVCDKAIFGTFERNFGRDIDLPWMTEGSRWTIQCRQRQQIPRIDVFPNGGWIKREHWRDGLAQTLRWSPRTGSHPFERRRMWGGKWASDSRNWNEKMRSCGRQGQKRFFYREIDDWKSKGFADSLHDEDGDGSNPHLGTSE